MKLCGQKSLIKYQLGISWDYNQNIIFMVHVKEKDIANDEF